MKKVDLTKKKEIDYGRKLLEFSQATINYSKKGFISLYDFLKKPKEIPLKLKLFWEMIKDEAHHYWVGTKLLWTEIKTANEIMGRVLKGHMMTRRERLQLIRTTQDLLRLVPFSVFVIVPFMELLLPLAIKLFPNMLPSTFEDSLKKEENLKKELAMRLGVASFFIETFRNMAEKKQKDSDEEATASELIEFMEKAKMGESISNEAVIRIARLFKDELTLSNISRPQLVTMCQFMGLVPFGTDAFLRFQLRTKLKSLKEDDKRILWEGVDSLTHQELRDACQERGMRATGLNTFGYRKQMREWLDLSMQKQIPTAVLIMSRAFVLKTTELNTTVYTAEETLKTSLTAFDDEVINEIIVESALTAEDKNPKIKKRRLESILHQNELIREEIEESAGAKKRDEEKTKERLASQETKAIPPVVEAPLLAKLNEEAIGSSRLVSGSIGPGDVMTPEQIASESPRQFQEDLQISSKESLSSSEESNASIVSDTAKPLSMAQLIALTDLTNYSAVEREKTELAALQEMVGTLEHEMEMELNSTEKEDDKKEKDKKEEPEKMDDSDSDNEIEDQNIRRMKSVLKGMMKKLEAKVKQTENELGNKFQRLDKDRDGVFDSDELHEIVMKIFKKKNLSPHEAEELISILDQDKDGKVTVQELRTYVAERKIQLEHEEFETQKPKENEKTKKNPNNTE